MASLRYEWMLRGFFLRPLPHLPPKRQYNIELFCLLFPWISTPVQTVRKGSRLTISDVSSPKLVLHSGYDFIHAYQGIHIAFIEVSRIQQLGRSPFLGS